MHDSDAGSGDGASQRGVCAGVPGGRIAILYISYDGLLEPLGQSQVLPYLRRLSPRREVTVLSYEKAADWAEQARRAGIGQELAQAGIRWVALRYHKSPALPAKAYDLAAGLVVCAYLAARRRISVVHARGYVPAVLALALKLAFGTCFIFDMRDFWADEKVDGGQWRRDSFLFRMTKWFERRFLTQADVVVSLTRAGAAALRGFPCLKARSPRIVVIPTCTDLSLFRPLARSGAPRRGFALGYLGSVDSRYMFGEVLECLKVLQSLVAEASLVVINRGQHDSIRRELRRHRIPPQRVLLTSAEHSEVPSFLAEVDAGLFFYRPGFSTLGTAPTRLGEFLACGVPCLSNAGVGDTEEILEGQGLGVVLRDFSSRSREEAVKRLVRIAGSPGVRERCAEAARRHFSLDDGVRSYDAIYDSLPSRR